MAYNNRLKITKEDYSRLESLLDGFLNDEDPTLKDYLRLYFHRAKMGNYSQTRISFDVYHLMTQWLGLHIDSRSSDYDFLRSGLYTYLNDDNLESALKSLLWDINSPLFIGAKFEG